MGLPHQKTSGEEEVICYLSELITLQLTFVIHNTNRSVRECIKRRLPQLTDYPFTSKELRAIAAAPMSAYEVEYRWRRLEEEQGGTIRFVPNIAEE